MIHHASLEIRADQLADCVAFWVVLGWNETPVAPGILDHGTWLERQGNQIHLQLVDDPSVPHGAHIALVDGNIDETVARIIDAGYELLERERYWGARRIFTRCPAGHRVELMAAPPG
ncbi:MAG: VOC family protein [Solirubrobacteraceae bacterium]|nr:VOC family protein [Patulibacter sp.]